MSQWTEDRLDRLQRAVDGEPLMNAPLKLTDRCDRCSAQAYVRVNLMNTVTPLLFCLHDWTKNRVVLSEIALYVQDDTHLLKV